jgi:hypothetical protein
VSKECRHELRQLRPGQPGGVTLLRRQTLRRFLRALAAREWDELASEFAPDLVVEDHRPLGWGTLHSRNELLVYMRSLADLAPDVTVHLEHVLALGIRGALTIRRTVGTREGGRFEIPWVILEMLGPDRRIQQWHFYNPEQLDEARARFEELRSRR